MTIRLRLKNEVDKMSRIKYQLNDVNLFDKADWEKMSKFLIEYLPKFESAFQQVIKQLK